LQLQFIFNLSEKLPTSGACKHGLQTQDVAYKQCVKIGLTK